MKSLFVIFAWFCLSIGVILTSLASYYFLQKFNLIPKKNGEVLAEQQNSKFMEELNSSKRTGVESLAEIEDARAFIVARFLERYDSPLKPYDYYGKTLVQIADRYNLDFRLMPAIAMQESNLCKSHPAETHNCLGFGIHERGTLGFDSYEEGFDRAAREIKRNYIDQGLTTPQEIMTKYTPSSKGSWAESVNQWMAEMRYDDRALGKKLKTNADVLEFTGEASPSAN